MARASSWHLKSRIAAWEERPSSGGEQRSLGGNGQARLSNERRVVLRDEEQRISMCCELGHLSGGEEGR